MLEQRVARLEEKMDRIEQILLRLEPKISEMSGELRQMPKAIDYAGIRAEIFELKGRVANLPSTWVLMSFTLTACLASAGLAFAIARLLQS